MGNLFNKDFRDFIEALNNHNVDYILVGGYSVIIYGYSRTTGDMDIWVKQTPRNYQKIVKAFNSFGMPTFDMTESNFLGLEMDVFRFGSPPVRIDLMTKVLGMDFEKTYENVSQYKDDGLIVNVIHINDLKKAKLASGRNKDLNDLENLE